MDQPSDDPVHDMDVRIEAEQIRHIFTQTPIYVPMVIPGALLSVVLLWPATTPAVAIGWCALIWIIYIALWLLAWRWKKAQVDDSDMRNWALPYIVLAWLATAAWGMAGVLFFHADSLVYQSLLFVILIIGSAAITTTSTAYSPTFYPVVLVLLPLIIRLLFENDMIYQLLASGLFAFLIMLFFLHKNSHELFLSSLKLRFINESLSARLALQKDIAEQENAAKSRFLAAASHDLRQPLCALGLFLGELRQLKQSPESEQLLERMHETLHSMNQLFDGVLDVSRFEVGVVNAQPEVFCVADLLDRLGEEYGVRAQARKLAFHCCKSRQEIYTDPILLHRILRNLLENAIHYTHSGEVRLSCYKNGNSLCLQVSDTGIGIAEENLQSIFDAFQQLDKSAHTHSRGIGLGLSVVKQLVRVLGLELRVQSIPGRGTNFSLDIPCAEKNPQLGSQQSVVINNLDGASILILQEQGRSADNCQNIISTLNLWDCTIHSITELADVEAVLRDSARQVDILLLDLECANRSDKVERVESLCHTYRPHLPVVLIANNGRDLCEQSVNNKQIKCVDRDISPARLATLFRFLLNSRGAS